MLTNVRLLNFKCFVDASVPFGGLTLLCGINGMGKSTIVQSILLLRQSYQQQMFPHFGLALNGDLISLGRSTDALCDYSEQDQLEIHLSFDDADQLKVAARHDVNADVMKIVSIYGFNADTPSRSLFGNDFQFVSAERIGPRPFFEVSEFEVRDRQSVGVRGQYAANFLSTYSNKQVSEGLAEPGADSSSLVDQVNYWLGGVSPGVRIKVEPHRGLDVVSVRYAFARRLDMSNEFRSTNVGFGLSYILPVLVSLLAAEKGAMVIVENPESNIHPKGQAMLGRLFAKAAACGIQIIVETHSDHFLNGVRIAVKEKAIGPEAVRISFFDRETATKSHNVMVHNPTIDSNGKLSGIVPGFFDEFEKSLYELL